MPSISLQDLHGPFSRTAIGVVAPFDLELDAELWRWLPSDVDVLVTRTPFVDDRVTVGFAQEISDLQDIRVGVRAVTAGRAAVAAYACTSGSFVRGRAGEAELTDAMRTAGAVEALTTSGALAEALEALGLRRVSVMTPYLSELGSMLDAYLEEFGVSVVGHASMGLDHEVWAVDYQRTANYIREADHPDAEAIVVSCTNLPTYDLIAPLEAELGKPIISANQATVWAALRRLGRQAVGAGQALVERGERQWASRADRVVFPGELEAVDAAVQEVLLPSV